jgi:hypothetical protein
MAQDKNIPEGHITLKEAAHISGYAPDYVGQLIRKGKLYGRQVYLNTAWVTTEAALREYMLKDETARAGAGGKLQMIENALLSETRLTSFFKGLLYCIFGAAVVLCLILFYVLSVNIERSLEESALRKASSYEARP